MLVRGAGKGRETGHGCGLQGLIGVQGAALRLLSGQRGHIGSPSQTEIWRRWEVAGQRSACDGVGWAEGQACKSGVYCMAPTVRRPPVLPVLVLLVRQPHAHVVPRRVEVDGSSESLRARAHCKTMEARPVLRQERCLGTCAILMVTVVWDSERRTYNGAADGPLRAVGVFRAVVDVVLLVGGLLLHHLS